MEKKSSGCGMSFEFVLFIVFLILKLTHVISWSWVWVFAPLWIPLAILLVLLGVLGLVVLAKELRS